MKTETTLSDKSHRQLRAWFKEQYRIRDQGTAMKLSPNQQAAIDVLKEGGYIRNEAGVVSLYDKEGKWSPLRFGWPTYAALKRLNLIERKEYVARVVKSGVWERWGLVEEKGNQ